MLSTLRRLAHRRPRGDRGVTLMELVVTMVIAVIIGATATQWVVSSSDALTATSNTDLVNASARNTLQSWGKMLQLAGASTSAGHTNGIQSLSATSISFTAYLRNSGSCPANTACADLTTTAVTLALSNSQLIDTIGTASSSFDVTDPTTVDAAGGCLFTAYSASGRLGCSSLTSTQLASITSITLSFTVTTKDGHTRSYQTTAALAG